jgi:exonuclease III
MLLNTPWETDELLQGSIIFLCETRRVDDVSGFFSKHIVWQIPAENGRPGQGLLMAVPESDWYCAEVVQQDSDIIAILLRDGAGTALALIIGVYIPPRSSPRLLNLDIQERYAVLHSIIAEHPAVPLLVMGDFNCTHLPSDSSEHAQGMRCCAQQHGLQVCTDAPTIDWDYMWTPSICPVPSFVHRNGQGAPKRIDHVLACSQMVDMHVVTRVLPNKYDMSDHYPVTASFMVVPAVLAPPVGDSKSRPQRIIWRSCCRQPYAQHLLQHSHVLQQRMLSALAQNDIDGALQHLMQSVDDAARSAKMRCARAAPSRPRRLPYMTNDLEHARKVLRASVKWDLQQYKQLRVAFQRHMRSRKRIWLQHRARSVLSSLKHDSHSVYAQLAGKSRKCIPKPLRHPGHWHAFISNLASPAAAPDPRPLPIVEDTSALLQVAAHLNVPFECAEVAIALSRLNNHRSPGLSAFCAEFFKYATYQPPPSDGKLPPAEHVLLQSLTILMNAVFKQGVVPARWDLSLITPVHKRGAMLDTANYRPIAVGEPLARLYAVLLQQRLDSHLEDNALRPDSQAGFRRGLSTSHQLFVVQHFIDKCCHEKKALYACWVDLKSAYDFVVRHVLWSCMARKAIHGTFLNAVKSLYASPRYAVCVDSKVGPAMHSIVGVRQGCPLSPLLFGIMLDDLTGCLLKSVHHAPCLDAYCDYMEEASTGHMQHYKSRPVPNLDFADDIIMLSTSLQGTQGLLRELQFFLQKSWHGHQCTQNAYCPVGTWLSEIT